MTFQFRVSSHFIKSLSDKELPATALIGLEEGYDSESLRILAGLNENESPFKLFDYFQRALKELNIEERSKEESLKQIASYYAQRVVREHLDPYEAFEILDRLVGSSIRDHEAIGLEDLYIDYICIWEVQGDGLRLHEGSGLTKKEYIISKKNDLFLKFATLLKEPGSA